LLLLVAAIIGKLGGTVLAGFARVGCTASLLLGVSMIPRAEIAMVVIGHGHDAGEEVVPSSVYAGMVLVSVATCTLTPLVLRPLLRRRSQSPDAEAESTASAGTKRNGSSDSTRNG
jgi:Kef-type K+ transport system membrane component KefB